MDLDRRVSYLSALAELAVLWIILARRLHWNIIHLIIWEETWVCSDGCILHGCKLKEQWVGSGHAC